MVTQFPGTWGGFLRESFKLNPSNPLEIGSDQMSLTPFVLICVTAVLWDGRSRVAFNAHGKLKFRARKNIWDRGSSTRI